MSCRLEWVWHNIPFIELKHEWNTAVTVEEIVNTIKTDSDIDAIFIQICEISNTYSS